MLSLLVFVDRIATAVLNATTWLSSSQDHLQIPRFVTVTVTVTVIGEDGSSITMTRNLILQAFY